MGGGTTMVAHCYYVPLSTFRPTPSKQCWLLMEVKPMSCFSTETCSGVMNSALQDSMLEIGGEGLSCLETSVPLGIDLMSGQTSLGFGCLKWTSSKFSSQEKV